MNRPGKDSLLRAALAVSMALAGIPHPALAQPADDNEAPAEPAPTSAPIPVPTQKMTLTDMAWLVGRWQGIWGSRVAQQAWMPPSAGVMVGTFQLAENGNTLVIEMFTLVERHDGIHLYIRHFTPGLAAWENSEPTVLNLTSMDPKTAVFENPTNGQPRRALLKRIDADTYVSRSEIVGGQNNLQITEITYHRHKESRPPRH